MRSLCLFYKICKDHTPPYLHNFQSSYSFRTANDIPSFRVKHGLFKSSFLPSTIIKWNNLDYHLRNAASISVFKQNILKLIHLGPNKVCNVHKPTGLKLLIKLRLELSHLRTHKFSHNFSGCLDELCICGTNIESTNHFLLQCSLYLFERQTLMEKIGDVEISILDQNETYLCYTLLFGSNKLSDFKSVCIFSATIEYILSTEMFNVPL